MQNKKNRKILLVITLMFFCIVCIGNIAFADNFNFNNFDSDDNESINKVTQNVMGTAIQVIKIVATGTSIIMLSYIGIKYMTAAPTEKAYFKRSAGIFVLGAVLVFAAGNILSIIVSFVDKNL